MENQIDSKPKGHRRRLEAIASRLESMRRWLVSLRAELPDLVGALGPSNSSKCDSVICE